MAEDQWETFLLAASFGGVPIDIQETSDSMGRALARHTYPYRDGTDLEDVGSEPRTTECRIVFFGTGDGDDIRARISAFLAAVNSGRAQTFVHPITGAYKARASNVQMSAAAEPRDTVMISCTFEEDTTEPAVFDVSSGAPSSTGAEAVASASKALDDALLEVQAEDLINNDGVLSDDLAEPITVGATATATVAKWSDPASALNVRDVTNQAVTLTRQIEAEVERLELATDVSRYPLIRAFTDLQAAVRKAAQAVAATSPRIVEFTVTAPIPLIILCARTYGAEDAAAREEEILQLNDIRNPARLEPGQKIAGPSPTSTLPQGRSVA